MLSRTGFSELPRPQRPGLLADLGARLQSAEQRSLMDPAISERW